MKKIVFVDIPMKEIIISENKLCYKYSGNKSLENKVEVVYPINSILASTLKTDDDVRIILITKNGGEKKALENIVNYKDELNTINSKIGAKIFYEELQSEFIETIDIHEKIFRKCISVLEKDSQIYCDITYGPKSLPIILFCVLSFAEKFFNSDIKNIIYGKVDFIRENSLEKPIPKNPEIYDLTSLYYLNSLTNTMNFNTEKEALSALDTFFTI